MRIGVIEGDSTLQFDEVRHAASLSDGRVLVVDAGARQVLVYSPEGTRLAVHGGAGEGPGEFRAIESAWTAAGDTVILYDSRSRRLTWISLADGALRDRAVAGGGAGDVRILGPESDGSVLLEVMESHPDLTRADYSYSRDTLAVVAVPQTGEPITILRIAGSETLFWLAASDGQPSYVVTIELPFATHVVAAAIEPGLFVAHGLRRQIEIHDMTGTLRSISRITPDRVRPLTPGDRDRFVQLQVDRARESGQVDPTARERIARDQVDMVPSDHVVPPFDRILTDGTGVWIRDYVLPWEAERPQTWTVFDSEGRALARATTPAGMLVTHISADRITGIVRGDFDEQYVVTYGLLRRSENQR
jgi:hypothetical protein